MGNPVARLLDGSTHGGQIITSCQHFSVEGQLVARVGDILLCPIHGPSPIVTGCPTWDVEGKAVARTTSLCACGAEIIGGSKMLTCE